MLKIFFIYLLLVASLVAETPENKTLSGVATPNLENQDTPDNAHLTKWLISNKSDLDKIIETTAKESKTKWFSESDVKKNSPEPIAPPVVKTKIDEDNYIEYTAQKGDTIYSISHKYNIPPDDVLTWNNMDSPASLKEGQKVKIYLYKSVTSDNGLENNKSTSSEETFADVKDSYPQYSYYKVKAGDTFNLIAKSHNMTANELVVLNHLEENQILSIGMILKVNSNYGSNNVPTNTILKDGFAWPAVGRLVMPFGLQEKGVFNEGINIALNKGTTIKATQDGIITYTGSAVKNFGNIIIIQHDHNWLSVYANLSETLVKKGQSVKKGTLIAKSGDSGTASSPQLHFELRYNIKPMDPLNYLNSYN